MRPSHLTGITIIIACSFGIGNCKNRQPSSQPLQNPISQASELCQQMHLAYANSATHNDLLTNDNGENLSFEEHIVLLIEQMEDVLDDVQTAGSVLDEGAENNSDQVPGTIEGEVAAFLATSEGEEKSQLQGELNAQAQSLLATQVELETCIGATSGYQTEPIAGLSLAPIRRTRNKTFAHEPIPPPRNTRFQSRSKSQSSEGIFDVITIPARARYRAMQQVIAHPGIFNSIIESFGKDLHDFTEITGFPKSVRTTKVTAEHFEFVLPKSGKFVVSPRNADGSHYLYVDMKTLQGGYDYHRAVLVQVVLNELGGRTTHIPLSESTLVFRIRLSSYSTAPGVSGVRDNYELIVEDIKVRGGGLVKAMRAKAMSPLMVKRAEARFDRFRTLSTTINAIVLSRVQSAFIKILKIAGVGLYIISIPIIAANYTFNLETGTPLINAASAIWYLPAIWALYKSPEFFVPGADHY